MGIDTCISPLFLVDEVEALIQSKYADNDEIKSILVEFQQDLEIIHRFTKKLIEFENNKANKRTLRKHYNVYKSEKSINLFGSVV